MTNQDKLNFKEKYQNNPVAFIEDMYPDIKLHEYQQNKVKFRNRQITDKKCKCKSYD